MKKKMGFVVDKVSEDSFYENLLLGLSKVLEKCPCISHLNLKRLPGVRQVDIRSWEHNNGVILPEDLRAFYSSTNGFLYTYEFSYDFSTVNEEDKARRKGKIEINSISELIRAYGHDAKNTGQIEQIGKKFKLTLSRESKVFELATVDENGKVVLVYLSSYSVPNIWLCVGQTTFEYLGEDFTTYFRMCLAHLGIPSWQYVFSEVGLPEWSREMFNLIVPGVLVDDKNLVDIPKIHFDHVNKIDPNIFAMPQNISAGLNLERTSTLKNLDNLKKEKKSKICNLPKRCTSGKAKK